MCIIVLNDNHGNRSNLYRDIAMDVRHLAFSKVRNLAADRMERVKGHQRTTLPNFMTIGQTAVEIMARKSVGPILICQ